LLGQINGWLNQAYELIKGKTIPMSERTLDCDIQVLGAFSLEFLFN
jgi:hypothetical protein